MVLKEEWRDIEGYEGLYQVSNLGRVRSLDRLVNNHSGLKRSIKGHVLKDTLCNNRGHRKIEIQKNKKRRSFLVHRLVALAFLPNPKKKSEVNHIDANVENNNVSNLEWVTPEENREHYRRYHKQHVAFYYDKSKKKNKYYCRLYYGKMSFSLGYYSTKEEATMVFVETYLEWYGHLPRIKGDG